MTQELSNRIRADEHSTDLAKSFSFYASIFWSAEQTFFFLAVTCLFLSAFG